jgi:ubiquitin-conjugating enzyme E2 Q
VRILLIRYPSQYEIRNNPETVDLLVSIAYTAAAEKVIDDPLPKGMGLRVPVPDPKDVVPVVVPPYNYAQPVPVPSTTTTEPTGTVVCGPDRLCDFDDLNIWEVSQWA